MRVCGSDYNCILRDVVFFAHCISYYISIFFRYEAYLGRDYHTGLAYIFIIRQNQNTRKKWVVDALRKVFSNHAVHPDVPFKMALTMAWQRYWELEKT